ncbi:MAG: hypothetical protein WC854_09785 [Bacteroidales bacterium]
MKTKKIILLTLISVALIMSCTKQPYWDIPKDASGNAIITQVSKTTSAGITLLDPSFTVTATLPNAKSGDVMTAELVKPQVPSWAPGGATQILPIAGTKKDVTVDADLKISVTYTKEVATLAILNDWVKCVISGATESGIIRLDLISAFSVTKPKVSGKEVVIIRTAEVAKFEVKVVPKIAPYTANLVAERKNGARGTWVAVPGGPFGIPQPYLIPIAGTNFVTSDTMFYRFTATSGSLTEVYNTSVVVIEPYFFFTKKGAVLTVGGSSAGRNLLTNTGVAANAATAHITANVSSGALVLQAGSAFTGTIKFVPTTVAKYTDNKSAVAMADFAAGTPTATADPIAGAGVYIFKLVKGANPEDTFYGLLRVTSVVPGVSASFEYKIGDSYKHVALL